MLNQNHNVHKRTNSKILLTILCIFGLLFSYSCSCKNNVTGPGNDGLEDGKVTNYIPKTYTATRSGNTLIIVNSDDSGIKQAATISFANAKVTSVTVDVGTTGIAADVFKYENDGLTMTAFGGVTTSRQKVTATFILAPNDSRDTLINPTETVEIEVVKATKIDVDNHISKLFQPDANSVQFQAGNHTFMFKLGTWNKDTFTLELDDTNPDATDKGEDLTVGYFESEVERLWKTIDEYNKYCEGIEWINAQGAGTSTLAVYLKLKFKPEVEIDNPDQEYVIKAPLKGKGNWIN